MILRLSAFRPLITFVILVCATAQSHARASTPPEPADRSTRWSGESGVASWYGSAYHGHRAADGSRFDQYRLTAAHPWLPFGTRIRITLGNTGHSVIVVVTDRLYAKGRVVDLSHAAARELGIIRQGLATVSLAPV